MIPGDLKRIDASRFDLSKRLALYEDSRGTIVFLVDRKSRFIMKDTELFLERAAKIQNVTGKFPELCITGPICSKSKARIESEGIKITQL